MWPRRIPTPIEPKLPLTMGLSFDEWMEGNALRLFARDGTVDVTEGT
jgi:hypothetical protein